MPRKLQLIRSATMPDPESTPSDLEANGQALWRRVQAEYAVEDCGGVALLTQACRALDRAERCRARIDAEGEIIKTKHGPREHPLLKHELSNRAFVARTISRLGLDVEPTQNVGRPPGTFGRD
jgi:phage terminase small subunit